MTSPYLTRRLRSLDQVTGANVIQFPPRREPWPYEKGEPAPKFLQKETSDER